MCLAFGWKCDMPHKLAVLIGKMSVQEKIGILINSIESNESVYLKDSVRFDHWFIQC